MVRMAAMSTRPMRASHLGTRLLAERKERGREITAPTMVPRKAMQKVSSSR